MPQKKLIAVMGATGAQGGGLVRSILADRDGPFTARAITRNPTSEKGRALAALGAEVVAGDADDPETLETAFAGADCAYCVTNFWEHGSAERETRQAAALARATGRAGVAHVVWSTLDDTRKRVPLDDRRLPTLHERYKVPHLDGKGEANRFFEEEAGPTTFLLTSFYWENFIYFGMAPRPGPDGELVLALPLGGARLPGIGVEDIGRCAHGIFKRGAELAGKRVGIAGEILDGPGMAAGFARALGRKVTFQDVPFDVYRALGFPAADDLGNMFQYQALYNESFCAERDPRLSRALDPQLQTFDAWLEANKGRDPPGISHPSPTLFPSEERGITSTSSAARRGGHHEPLDLVRLDDGVELLHHPSTQVAAHHLRQPRVVTLGDVQVVPLPVHGAGGVHPQHQHRPRLARAVGRAAVDGERRTRRHVAHAWQLPLPARLVPRIEPLRREHAVLEPVRRVPLRAGRDLEGAHLLGHVHAGQVEGERVEAPPAQGRLGGREVAVPGLQLGPWPRHVEAELDDAVVGAQHRLAHRHHPGVRAELGEAAQPLRVISA